MLTPERHERILQKLREYKTITVQELTVQLNCSESTIRRDLSALDAEGLLKKIHGGATLLDEEGMREEYTVETKYSLHTDEKRRIAKMAALMIHDSDFVYLDAGTTTECLLDYLTCRDTVFVTNGLQIARRLSSQGHTVYLPAGRVKFVTDAVVGGRAIESISCYNFTLGFFGVNGITLQNGYTTPDEEEARMKKAAMSRCRRKIVLADPSKFGLLTAVTFAPLEAAEILTTALEDTRYREQTTLLEVDHLP